MARKQVKPIKPKPMAICAAFAAGHEVGFTAQGVERKRRHFTERDFAVALIASGVRGHKAMKETLAWMLQRGLVYQRNPKEAYILTAKGVHVTDRACQVTLKHRR